MGHARTVVVEYKNLIARTEEMIRDFQPAMSAGAVIGTVTRCRSNLLRSGVRRGLADATERMARAQLRNELARDRESHSIARTGRVHLHRSARASWNEAPRLGTWSARESMDSGTLGDRNARVRRTAALSALR
jgi:hypothetical protein